VRWQLKHRPVPRHAAHADWVRTGPSSSVAPRILPVPSQARQMHEPKHHGQTRDCAAGAKFNIARSPMRNCGDREQNSSRFEEVLRTAGGAGPMTQGQTQPLARRRDTAGHIGNLYPHVQVFRRTWTIFLQSGQPRCHGESSVAAFTLRPLSATSLSAWIRSRSAFRIEHCGWMPADE